MWHPHVYPASVHISGKDLKMERHGKGGMLTYYRCDGRFLPISSNKNFPGTRIGAI